MKGLERLMRNNHQSNPPIMKTIIQLTATLGLLLCSVCSLQAQDLEQRIDQLLSAQYPADQPGITALVAKDGKVLYRKAFGLANMELEVPMKPENIFEIGSITKQFTAVSILMLEEAGKLSVNDPLSKYIPDYPQGDQIKIHHLLNHTSGIKSYTNMPSFMSQARTDLTPIELIAVFKDQPMEFQPGEQYAYNNSAYILLGYIIEEVSGSTYEDFVETRIFKNLGMNNSMYGHKAELIKNRAFGYQPSEAGYNNAEYLSMTLPYAAGSLMSCVDDMLLWEQAIHKNTLISEASKKKAFTNYKLTNGNDIYYGYGWSVDEIHGVPTIEHGGGIFGYTTYAVYVPSEDLYAVVLHNGNGNSPTDITVKVTAEALEKPFPSQSKINLTAEQMKQWVGTYEFENDVVRYITFADGALYSEREGSENLKLFPISENEFYFEGSFSNYTFKKENGKNVAYFNSRIRKSKGLPSEKNKPEAKKEITLAPEALKSFVGTYKMQQGFEIDVTLEDGKIFAQPTGQSPAEIFPEGPTTFFLKVVRASIEFDQNDAGEVTGLTLSQGGQQMKGEKVN